jgi:glycerophosphoryl diester phosphodiesterase
MATPPRLKWHMLRRRKADPPHLRANLEAALRSGAACEVDIVFTADGHGVCLHDMTLERETTGSGPVALLARAEVERLRQRGTDGAILDSPPLFLDEVVDAARRIGVCAPALLQLDVKPALNDLPSGALSRMADALGDVGASFVAGGYDWAAICALRAAIPGLHGGFDPLALYPRRFAALGADAFRALVDRTLEIAPDAAIYYLEANLVLAASDAGVDLVGPLGARGAPIDAWTVDASRPDLRAVLARLIAAGCRQITTNDPETLAPLVEEIAVCS